MANADYGRTEKRKKNETQHVVHNFDLCVSAVCLLVDWYACSWAYLNRFDYSIVAVTTQKVFILNIEFAWFFSSLRSLILKSTNPVCKYCDYQSKLIWQPHTHTNPEAERESRFCMNLNNTFNHCHKLCEYFVISVLDWIDCDWLVTVSVSVNFKLN